MNPEQSTFVYKTVGDCQIEADVYRPTGPNASSAGVVWIHGGALINGSRTAIQPDQLQGYLEAGHTVIAIDYRLAPESKLPAIIEDLQDAFRWVQDAGPSLFGIDPERLVAVGHSAGGYLTLMSGVCVSPSPRALVAFYGYGDIVADWYTRPDPSYCQQPLVSEQDSGCLVRGRATSEVYEGRGKEQFYLYCRQQGIWPQEVGGREPRQEPAFFEPYCPLRNVSASYPPTLLLHGTADTDVPYAQSALMAAELGSHGIDSELITIEGGGHGFDGQMDDARVRAAFDKVLAFVAVHTTE